MNIEAMIKIHDFKFKVVGLGLIITGVCFMLTAVLECHDYECLDKRIRDLERRARLLELESAGHSEDISWLFKKRNEEAEENA